MEADDASGLPPQSVEKIFAILMFLTNMRAEDELQKVPLWKAHRLTGDRKGMWSLSVTSNWRLTFRVDEKAGEIFDLNYENYH